MLPTPLNQISSSELRYRSYQKGALLFRQGDTPKSLLFIVTGMVQLQRVTVEGDVVLLHTAKGGETFAEASLFSNAYHCDARAFSDVDVIELDKDNVLGLFQNNQEFAFELTKRFAEQIQGYRRKVELLAIRSATERVYAAMLEGLLTTDIKSFSFEIGLSHEVVYRPLSTLAAAQRIIKVKRGCFRIAK